MISTMCKENNDDDDHDHNNGDDELEPRKMRKIQQNEMKWNPRKNVTFDSKRREISFVIYSHSVFAFALSLGLPFFLNLLFFRIFLFSFFFSIFPLVL